MIVFGDLIVKKLLMRGFFSTKIYISITTKVYKETLRVTLRCKPKLSSSLGASPDVFYPSSRLRLFHHHDARLLPLPSRWTTNIGPVRLSYEPYYFSERTVFFSHNKSANSTFSHGFSAKANKAINVDHQPFLIPYETLTLVVLGESETVTTKKVGAPSRAPRNKGLRMEFKGLLLLRIWVGALLEWVFFLSLTLKSRVGGAGLLKLLLIGLFGKKRKK